MRLVVLIAAAILAAGCAGQVSPDSISATEDDASGPPASNSPATALGSHGSAPSSTGPKEPTSGLRSMASAAEASYEISPGMAPADRKDGIESTVNALLARYEGQDVQIRVAYRYSLASDLRADAPVLVSPTRPAGRALASEVARDANLWIENRQMNNGELVVSLSVPTSVDSVPLS